MSDWNLSVSAEPEPEPEPETASTFEWAEPDTQKSEPDPEKLLIDIYGATTTSS